MHILREVIMVAEAEVALAPVPVLVQVEDEQDVLKKIFMELSFTQERYIRLSNKITL